MFMFHSRFSDPSWSVMFGGERIFLMLGLNIFGGWIETQVLGAIKVCVKKK